MHGCQCAVELDQSTGVHCGIYANGVREVFAIGADDGFKWCTDGITPVRAGVGVAARARHRSDRPLS